MVEIEDIVSIPQVSIALGLAAGDLFFRLRQIATVVFIWKFTYM